MRASLLVLALSACGPEVDVVVTQQPCGEDVDTDVAPSLVVDEDGEALTVLRIPTWAGDADDFDPEITTDGRRINIREAWTESGDSVGDACWEAGVTLSQAPGKDWLFLWYQGEDVVPELTGRYP